MASSEETPLVNNRSAESAERGLVGVVRASSLPKAQATTAATFRFTKGHLQTFNSNTTQLSKNSPRHRIGVLNRGGNGGQEKSKESGDVLAVTSKQSKTRQRKNVGKYRRKHQDYATWKGRIGVHALYDEYDLKKLMSVIYQTLSTDWEVVDCYDVIRYVYTQYLCAITDYL